MPETEYVYLVVDVDVQGEQSIIVAFRESKVADEIASRLSNGHVERIVLVGGPDEQE